MLTELKAFTFGDAMRYAGADLLPGGKAPLIGRIIVDGVDGDLVISGGGSSRECVTIGFYTPTLYGTLALPHIAPARVIAEHVMARPQTAEDMIAAGFAVGQEVPTGALKVV